MTSTLIRQDASTASPFDAIRRTDADGEHWMARDLMDLMDYASWAKFAIVINKAKSSLALVEGPEVAEHHLSIRETDGGRWGNSKVEDFRLTRFGAYLAAMAGDDTKRAVAEARIYFAVQTRKAEIAERQNANNPAIPQSFADALQLAADQARQIETQAAQLEANAPKVAYVDNFLRNNDACLMRQLAKRIGFKEGDLRAELVDRKVIFRVPISRFSKSKQRDVIEYRYEASTKYMAWFIEGDQPKAPRHHNGQLRTTLYVTPAGKVGIARLLGRLDTTQLALEGAPA